MYAKSKSKCVSVVVIRVIRVFGYSRQPWSRSSRTILLKQLRVFYLLINEIKSAKYMTKQYWLLLRYLFAASLTCSHSSSYLGSKLSLHRFTTIMFCCNVGCDGQIHLLLVRIIQKHVIKTLFSRSLHIIKQSKKSRNICYIKYLKLMFIQQNLLCDIPHRFPISDQNITKSQDKSSRNWTDGTG